MNNFVQSENEAAKLEASKLLTASEAKELQSSFDEDVYREYVSRINKRISDEAKRNVGFVVITESPFCYWASYVEDKVAFAFRNRKTDFQRTSRKRFSYC